MAQLEKAQKASEEKESELEKMTRMMKTTLEIQMQNKVDLTVGTNQVHELQAQMKGTTLGTHLLLLSFFVLSCFVIRRRLFFWGG